ncbi:hypothetical protein BCV69DRAFT_291648 [Microstroma glucosiphilum]|uniref:Uncharacterized protein n=1 Tax=Pseudomicrostroma glucosiphilum TaxID=1684307 RepID=A0A316UGY6_9BASI|nr:hypothetical protein BCV69DRAFT_291648 [Pseudomicrostroma glucosiphilum]PWN23591.1 hypothetical protein BCV69DRAFT_291648 [Pseudomicrostroma glucosiphilum]
MVSRTEILATPETTSSAPASTGLLAPPPLYSPLVASSSSNALQVNGQGALQFDIVPRAEDASFQVGYQGLQGRGFEAWLRGDVLIKWAHSAAQRTGNDGGLQNDSLPSGSTQSPFSQCTIDLLATETVRLAEVSMVHQLHHSSLVLWRSPDAPASSSDAAIGSSRPPATMPFEFLLPEELPHCIHLPSVKLEYHLIATLLPAPWATEQELVTTSVLTHITRYTPPTPPHQLLPTSVPTESFSESPKTWQIEDPTKVHITLETTLLRRADPIRIKIKVPPPDEKAVEKGLRIRSVEAELIRVVRGRREKRKRPALTGGPHRSLLNSREKGKGSFRQAQPSSSTLENGTTPAVHHNATSDGWEPHSQLLYSDEDDDVDSNQDSRGPSSPQLTQASSEGGASASGSSSNPPVPIAPASPSTISDGSFTTVLAHSGKACRFSMRKPLALNLTLVPPFRSPALPHPSPDHDAPPSGLSPLTSGTTGGGGGCESVTQQTALSSVEFRVRIYVRLRGGQPGEAVWREGSDGAGGTPVAPTASGPNVKRDIVVEQEVFVLPSLAGIDSEGELSRGEDVTDSKLSVTQQSSQEVEAEEFDGYEDFQDANDSFVDTLAQLPRISLDGPTSHPSEAVRMINGNPAFVTQRRPDGHGGDDQPPNLEESQHDLQIFPGQGEQDALLPPPPHSAHVEGNVPNALRHRDGDATSGDVEAQPPPAWAERDSDAGNEGGPVFIEGVGVGELRRRGLGANGVGQSEGVTFRSRSPPPDFEATLGYPHTRGSLDLTRHAGVSSGHREADDSSASSPLAGSVPSFDTPPTPPPPLSSDPNDQSQSGARPAYHHQSSSATPVEPPPYAQPLSTLQARGVASTGASDSPRRPHTPPHYVSVDDPNIASSRKGEARSCILFDTGRIFLTSARSDPSALDAGYRCCSASCILAPSRSVAAP